MADITLWGFSGSTYVRTVRMVLAEKGVTDYEQVPVNVLEGEPRSEEHKARHPFGKVPVLDHGDFRILETSAIVPYLDAVLPGRSVLPQDPRERAVSDMVTSVIDSYGYNALLGGVVAYHLFPDFVGGQDDEAHKKALDTGTRVLRFIMEQRGAKPFIASSDHGAVDYTLAPIVAYLTMTPHKDEMLAIGGMSDWWDRVSALDSFKATDPT